MGQQGPRSWRNTYEDVKGRVAVGVVLLALGLGFVGWRLTEPALGWDGTAYATLSLFAISFAHSGSMHWTLNVARFLAVVVVYWAAVSVSVKVLRGRSGTRRAKGLKGHVVVVGSAGEVETLALGYRDRGEEVVVVGDVAAQEADHLARRSVVTVPMPNDTDPSDKDLKAIVNNASRVVLVGRTDEATLDLVHRLHRLGHDTMPPTTVLFDHRDFASQCTHAYHDVALCRSTQLAIALLRSHPPYLESAVSPPPVVIGDGDTAAEIVRRIISGWQQPGECLTVHCLGPDSGWVEAARADFEDRADLQYTYVGPHPGQAVAAVKELVARWKSPGKPDSFTLSPPPVYVAFADLALTVPISSAVAEALQDPRVVGLVDNDSSWLDTLSPAAARLVSRRALQSDPRTLELDPRRMLADEIVADAARWPHDVPGALGPVSREKSEVATVASQAPAVQAAVRAVAWHAPEILAAGGVRLEDRRWVAEPVFLLAPDQLRAVAQALADVLGAVVDSRDPEATGSGTATEVAVRRLELAARLPILAARSGWTPVLDDQRPQPLSTENLQRWARMAHDGYTTVSHATGNATRSDNYGKGWDDLSDVDQRSNIAQVADIPVKLATVGFTWREAASPLPISFTKEQVELLAENEHRRWAHFQLRNGRPGHEWNVAWSGLTEEQKEYDRNAVRLIPLMLASVGREIVPMQSVAAQ